jgi:RNA polymerase sigma factor (sigma-70 family)
MQQLYDAFGRGLRMYLCRQLGMQEVDDKMHDTFLVVVKTIQKGELREPERLMGFVRTIARRAVAGHIDQMVRRRSLEFSLEDEILACDCRTPQDSYLTQEKIDVMSEVLRQMSTRDREILTRFYLHEQSPDRICAEMQLTATQFRLLKSRAKERFSELGRKRLAKKDPLRMSTSLESPDSMHVPQTYPELREHAERLRDTKIFESFPPDLALAGQ